MTAILVTAAVVALLVVLVVGKSVHRIGPAEVGLVNKKLGLRKLPEDNPIAFRGEAGYQAELLMPGLRWKLWPVFSVQKFPWVQVPAGEIGVVIAQKGVQRPVLSPGSLEPIHPIAFLVLTKEQVYGVPISPELRSRNGHGLTAG